MKQNHNRKYFVDLFSFSFLPLRTKPHVFSFELSYFIYNQKVIPQKCLIDLSLFSFPLKTLTCCVPRLQSNCGTSQMRWMLQDWNILIHLKTPKRVMQRSFSWFSLKIFHVILLTQSVDFNQNWAFFRYLFKFLLNEICPLTLELELILAWNFYLWLTVAYVKIWKQHKLVNVAKLKYDAIHALKE